MTETLAHGYSSESTRPVSYPMNTNMRGFRGFSKIVASLCFGREPQHWKGKKISQGQILILTSPQSFPPRKEMVVIQIKRFMIITQDIFLSNHLL